MDFILHTKENLLLVVFHLNLVNRSVSFQFLQVIFILDCVLTNLCAVSEFVQHELLVKHVNFLSEAISLDLILLLMAHDIKDLTEVHVKSVARAHADDFLVSAKEPHANILQL